MLLLLQQTIHFQLLYSQSCQKRQAFKHYTVKTPHLYSSPNTNVHSCNKQENHYIYSTIPLKGQVSQTVYNSTGYQYLSMVWYFLSLQCSLPHCYGQQSLLDRIVYTTCLVVLCSHDWLCLLLNTAAGFGYHEHDLK